MSLKIADISVQVPTSELKFHTSVPLLGGEGGVENPKEKEITLKVESEIKAVEVETKAIWRCF